MKTKKVAKKNIKKMKGGVSLAEVNSATAQIGGGSYSDFLALIQNLLKGRLKPGIITKPTPVGPIICVFPGEVRKKSG